MLDGVTYIDIVQLITLLVYAWVLFFSIKRSKLEGGISVFIFVVVVVYCRLKLAVALSELYQSNDNYYLAINWFASLEPRLFTDFDSVALWLSTVLGLFAALAMLVTMMILGISAVVLRGTCLVTEAEYRQKLNKLTKAKHSIKVGQFFMPLQLETRSLAIYGEPGSGKTQIILRIISDLIKRSDKFVCLDVGGDIYGSLGNPDDTVLSATHEEGVEYSPFADIHKKSDCNIIANSFIPKGSGDTEAWNGYARDVLIVILERCFELSKTTNKDLLYFACDADIQTLQKLVKGTAVQRILEGKNEKKVDDIMGIISQHLKPLSMFSPDAGRNSFSLKSWVKNDVGCGNLWLIYDDSSAIASASLRAVWMNILIQETLSLAPDPERRLCFVLDELASNGVIDGLSQAVSRGRKYGMSFVFAVQNLSQLHQSYGRDETHSILGSVGHTVILRSPDPDTAEYLSKCIGDTEVEREQVSSQGKGNGVNIQKVRETKRAVLPSEISELNDLNGFIKISGVGWSRLRVPFIKFQKRNTLHIKLTDYQSSEKPRGDGSSPLSIDDV